MFRHCEKLLNVKTLSTENSFDVLKLLILQLLTDFPISIYIFFELTF